LRWSEQVCILSEGFFEGAAHLAAGGSGALDESGVQTYHLLPDAFLH
jgi:hypothetical protein